MTVPIPLTMEDGDAKEKESANEKHAVDWDNHTGLIASIARFSHDHYYISLALFLIMTLGLSGIIFVPGMGNEKCAAGGQAQFTVCDQSNHDWELSFLNQSKFKDAVAAVRKESMPGFNELTGRASGSEVKARSQRSDLQGVSLVYGHENEADRDASIFTPARVQAMCKIEGASVAWFASLQACRLAVLCLLWPVERERRGAEGQGGRGQGFGEDRSYCRSDACPCVLVCPHACASMTSLSLTHTLSLSLSLSLSVSLSAHVGVDVRACSCVLT